MNSTNILVTGAGSPGISGTIYSLRNNYDKRKFKIFTTDMNEEVVGKFLADEFIKIPPAKQASNYLDAITNICLRNKIGIIVPQNTAELNLLSQHEENFLKNGIKVLLSSHEAINVANNKHELMNVCQENNIPVASFYLVETADDLLRSAKLLGWPDQKIVIKPPVSNGMRGVRIIDENLDLKEMFYEEKPNSLNIKMKNLLEVLGENFPSLLVTEYLPGEEYSVDVLRKDNFSIEIPRIRNLVRSGITFNGSIEKNEEIIEYCRILSKQIDLKYCFGFQFKLDAQGTPKILESNPRIQGTMIMSTLAGANIIYNGIKLLLNEEIADMEVDWNYKFFRFWGGIGAGREGLESIRF
ncbi:ATP-grasp domain-containing protein [Lutimonas saemankumensis]|uniref:ATP-grasp domain-containing protein n=1 Tax=Lutimonas saemankumensis TaxID=483016 RepID=UPI001CD5F324|nr:ATP-grasp domain-containing protein [Lutimonas saemankumensis]MCA0931068.1 ATP-grasp domain-containing protein [Lutimonas saemankumensis]